MAVLKTADSDDSPFVVLPEKLVPLADAELKLLTGREFPSFDRRKTAKKLISSHAIGASYLHAANRSIQPLQNKSLVMTVKRLRKFDRYCLHLFQKTVIVLSRSITPDRMKKEKVMEDLQYLHYQTQLEEQELNEFLADGLLLSEVGTQTDNSNQTSTGESK
jgi:hypothetical protein